ncbi:TPA: tetratricopeptide repeat protein [Stenotrophomonas maltophilia]|jgi:hypothetical protein|uniref:Sel1 repeat family protein n=2 Tax=Pseudomonadota TaxID=1224 RepID=A0AAI9CJF4_STEMA|nr:tetratricopeptide repeat protein [Stenotrophomonas maltophilia]EKT4440585.1 sel1 repeat family protein [Stenotrophomonas maltophilia]EKZ1926499.1 sel1 repeat family protein [Stenotrophomonas maltophilia]EMB2744915.1 sel1 repeat family protein [Stenotrophomonas maltophilia]MBH1417635.1 sel1 repeat family protein [Stenotrophomonas maltophilia]MBH1572267.1 sel1 repeat family protein [Stenotrophomonas maltophilia]
MILGILVLLVLGFFFPPLWLVLIGYLIYIYASRHTRKERAVEGRIRAMIAAKKDVATFSELYYEAARSYAISKGCTVSDHEAASAGVMIDGKAWNAVFLRERDGGTTITLQDHAAVEKWIQNDVDSVIAAGKSVELAPDIRLMDTSTLARQRTDEAFQMLLGRAEDGEAEAQNEIGFCYGKGVYVAKNYKLAHQWYGKSAEQSFANAQFNLGVLHYQGLGCKRDIGQAENWFKLAAAQGHSNAQQNLRRIELEKPLVLEIYAVNQQLGKQKAPGLVDFELAHLYLDELKALIEDEEVRQGFVLAATTGQISLAKAAKIQDAVTWAWNLSSATPLTYHQIINAVSNDDWSVFNGMPESGSGT